MDLVNDDLRKRKTFEPLGWQKFACSLNAVNVPMDLVGNPDRRDYVQSTFVDDVSKEAQRKRVGRRRRRR